MVNVTVTVDTYGELSVAACIGASALPVRQGFKNGSVYFSPSRLAKLRAASRRHPGRGR